LEQVVGMATLAVPAAAPLVVSLRRSNVVQQQDGGRVTSVVVVLPVATSNSNLSVACLHYGTGIHQHRWPVVVYISPLMTLRSRLQQRVSSSNSSLGRSVMPSSSLRGFNSTKIYLSKRPIFVSFFCRFTDSTEEHHL
jgi:hypothetical protein